MKTVAERAAKLRPLRTFDSDAFRGDAAVSQELCNLILGFAMSYNDCRDLLFLHRNVQDESPGMPPRLNRRFGEHGGMAAHLLRLMFGAVHELGELIQKNGKALHDPFFDERVLPKLGKRERVMWGQVRDLAFQKPASKAMDAFVKLLRDKATYHYDAPDMFEVYDVRFPSGSREVDKVPLASVGDDVASTRFYFADAVAYTMIHREAEARGLEPIGAKMTEVLTDLMGSLRRIVEAFLQARRPWWDFEEEE